MTELICEWMECQVATKMKEVTRMMRRKKVDGCADDQKQRGCSRLASDQVQLL